MHLQGFSRAQGLHADGANETLQQSAEVECWGWLGGNGDSELVITLLAMMVVMMTMLEMRMVEGDGYVKVCFLNVLAVAFNKIECIRKSMGYRGACCW